MNPSSGATSVAVTGVITATFSEALASNPNFTVTAPAGAVAGALSRAGAVATFTPSAPLAQATVYSAVVSGGTGAAGATAAATVGWSFTTVGAVAPSIALSSTGLSYSAQQGGANPASQSITVTNAGGATLNGLSLGAVSYGAGASGWLAAPSLNTTMAPATLTVQPITAGMAPGSYSATIPVLSALASNSPQVLSVTFTVTSAGPAIVLTPASRSFSATQGGANPPSQVVSITNGGGGTLSGLNSPLIQFLSGGTGWLQVPTLSSTTAPANLTLQPITGGMVAGTYSANVFLAATSASNSPQIVSVTFTVAPSTLPPGIALSASSRTFAATQGGTNPASQSVAITNSGGGTLSGLSLGTITYGAGASGWLTGATLNTTTAPATLTLQTSTGTLVAGSYSASVPVLSALASNSPQTVNVTFTVTAATPAIALTPASRSFAATQGGANPASQTVTITNSGGGTLSGLSVGTITYGAGASGWLTGASLNTTTAPATLTLQPSIGSLATGSYTATVPVLSALASNSPQTVSVTLNVTASAQVVISGTADFESVPANTATGGLNYAGASFKPIRGAPVEIVAATGGATLASGTTNASGAYSITIPNPRSIIVRIRARLLRTASTGGQWDFSVHDNTSADAMYVMDSAAFTPASATATQNLRAHSGWSGTSYTATRAAAPFAILDVVYDATQKVLSASANAVFPALRLFWSVNNRPVSGNKSIGQITTTSFDGTAIYLLGAADTDTDEYDRHVVAHEWGHYFQEVFSRDDSIGGPWTGGQRLDMRVAFSEGWGNAWSGMALNALVYTDSSGFDQRSGRVVDLAAAPTSPRGWYAQRSVQYLLWQFHANALIGFTPIFNVLAAFPTTLPADGALSSIHSFSARLKAAVPAQAAAIDSLLAGQQITVQDAIGSGETNSGSVAVALPLYNIHTAALGANQNYCVSDAAGVAGNEHNKLGTHAFIRFTLGASGLRTITVSSTNGATTASDPDFTVRRSDGTTTAFFQAGGTSESASLTLAAGTHLIELFDFQLTRGSNAGINTGTRCFNLRID